MKTWRALVAVCILSGVLYAVDTHLKQSTINGYAPSQASVIISLNNLGASWESLESTSYWKQVRYEEGDMLRGPLVDLRKRLGIRPTPDRWNTWMGAHGVLGKTDSGWGVCVKPGLLLRGVHNWNRLFGESPVGGVWRFQDWHYGWRGDYLVVATKKSYVQRILSDEGVAVKANESSTAIGISFNESQTIPGHTLYIEPMGEFPVSGWIDAAFTTIPKRNEIKEASPDGAVLTITGAQLEETGAYIASFLPPWRNLDDVRSEWAQAHKIGRSGSWVDERDSASKPHDDYSTLVLHDMDTTSFLAVPSVYIRFAMSNALGDNPEVPDDASPYAWGHRDGWSALRKGTRMMSWAAWDFPVHHAANQIDAMNSYIDLSGDLTESEFDVHVTLDWKRATGYAEQIILAAVKGELLPEMNREDAEQKFGRIMPWFRHLGRLDCFGVMVDGRLQFHGALNVAQREEEAYE